MAKELTIEDLRVLADLAGLTLSDDELQRLLPGSIGLNNKSPRSAP